MMQWSPLSPPELPTWWSRRAIAVAAVAVLSTLAPASIARAQDDGPSFSIGGLAFGDFYGVASHHTAEGEGSGGAVLRRGYLTADLDVNDRWFGRVRLEANQAGEFETYTFTVDFKDLYLGWNAGRHRILFGLSPTPTFDLIESIWGLRYLMRTPMDLQGTGSRDTGVAARGPLNDSGSLSYRAMVGAGLEFGNESGDGRKWMGALSWNPAESWTLDFYADYEVLEGQADRATVQGFVGYVTERLRWGAQYSHQDRQEDPPVRLASAFAVVGAADDAAVILRVDRLFEPSAGGDNISYIPFDPTAPATMFVGAVEFRAHPLLTVTPNLVVIAYDRNDEGRKPDTDMLLRLTFFLDLE